MASESLWQQMRHIGNGGRRIADIASWDGQVPLCFVGLGNSLWKHKNILFKRATLSLIVTSQHSLSPPFLSQIVLNHHNSLCCSFKQARNTVKSRALNMRSVSTSGKQERNNRNNFLKVLIQSGWVSRRKRCYIERDQMSVLGTISGPALLCVLHIKCSFTHNL